MDELQLKEMIRSLLNEMGGDSAAKETAATDQNKAEKSAVSLQEYIFSIKRSDEILTQLHVNLVRKIIILMFEIVNFL